MKKPERKALKYKTARISYFSNYFLVIVIPFLFYLVLLPYLTNELYLNIAILILSAIILFLIFEPEVERTIRRYGITNNEVLKIEGIITKKIVSIPHQSIADVKVFKGVIGRIFNFGNIEVKGFKDSIFMKGIREPEVIEKIVENKIALFKGRIRKTGKEKK